MLNKIIFAVFFLIAGLMHFIAPSIYLEVIPGYLPFPVFLNTISGVLEIFIALLLFYYLFKKRKLTFAITSSYLAIFLLIVFIPAHVKFIQQNGCAGELCVPEWIGWVRLLVVHPLLIYWAWTIKK